MAPFNCVLTATQPNVSVLGSRLHPGNSTAGRLPSISQWRVDDEVLIITATASGAFPTHTLLLVHAEAVLQRPSPNQQVCMFARVSNAGFCFHFL